MSHHHVEYAMESLQEGVVIDESAEILEQPVAAAPPSTYSCGLPYYRWLHPHAKTKRLQYFNQILPDIYARTAHLLPEYENFDDLVKTELPRRWRDKEVLQALRRRLFVATKYWGRFRNMMGRISAFDIITIENGLSALTQLQADTAKAVDEKEKLNNLNCDEHQKVRKGYEERKEYTDEMLSIYSQLRQSVDDFIEELKRLRDEGQEREKLTEKDLEKARMQLKKRRQKEAKKKQRKREASKKQKGEKGGILLANPSEIAALAASGYPLDASADGNGDPSLLLSHESEHHPQHHPLDGHADSSNTAHHPAGAQAAQHAHQHQQQHLPAQHAHHDTKHEEDNDEGNVDIDDAADESEEENNVVVHH